MKALTKTLAAAALTISAATALPAHAHQTKTATVIAADYALACPVNAGQIHNGADDLVQLLKLKRELGEAGASRVATYAKEVDCGAFLPGAKFPVVAAPVGGPVAWISLGAADWSGRSWIIRRRDIEVTP